jgi:hypothetical protein
VCRRGSHGENTHGSCPTSTKIKQSSGHAKRLGNTTFGKPECDTSVRPLAGIFRNTVPKEKKEDPIPKRVEEIKHAEARTILESDHVETSKASERTMSSAKPLREFEQMDWVRIDFGEIFDKRRSFPNQKGMVKAVEMDFPPEKHVEQPYNLETTGGPCRGIAAEGTLGCARWSCPSR